MAHDTLPRDARIIALLIAANPSIKDAHPAVLSDALVYAEHAGRAGTIQQDDVTLAVQARVGWEMGGPVPKEHLMALATKTNAQSLPAVSDTYGIRVPAKHALTSVDFDIVPNKPPPGLNGPETYEEEYEEWEEDDTPEQPSGPQGDDLMVMDDPDEPIALVEDVAPMQNGGATAGEEAPTQVDEGAGSDADDLFGDAGEDDADKMDQDAPAPEPSGTSPSAGAKRKMEEDDNYD
ncbi:TFIID-31kDa domain-containing protein [Rhizoctonia solani AG-1 IA]|uniref:TFIID-31kDa domain-containing protein n=1 Tax=Thanatephorus cucumeris (strain AG1-IA) TaxID=983506 RepID=L8X8N4_THACA|nr:TFIID-31kDa domain-containing protein [Rhizoctonia solani AG-1 IA]